jgi:NAD+ synthase (glutamine-hydrolysing)
MFEGYVPVAAATPVIRVADCAYNAGQALALIKKAARENVQLLCLPELCITGYTCGDLFLQESLLDSARNALDTLVKESENENVLVAAGLPLAHNGKLFNVAAVFCRGRILGFVPKTHIPNYNEFYELRHFTPGSPDVRHIPFCGRDIPFGTKQLFRCDDVPEFTLAVEICEDLWAPNPPGTLHAMAGATIIANLSASDETIGKAAYRRMLAAGQSARLLCAYVYADAGYGESSTDMVFTGHNLICENGAILSESPPFGDGWAVSEIDTGSLIHDRRRINTFSGACEGYAVSSFSLERRGVSLTRFIDPAPFVPGNKLEKEAVCEEILNIQAAGLAKRLEHTACQTAVLGISGGLDSSLALLVAVRAFAKRGAPPSGILAVTMPCFGTSERTKGNARSLCDVLGVSCREIDISGSVRLHLQDIGHSEEDRNVVYENAQARTRTLALMDLANQSGGIVIGTGDLSELALGWATYNGDHMSMYAVNAGVPKTLVRHIVKHAAETCGNKKLSAVLEDILDTPVSPELLPPEEGQISQRTEQLVGPYELHDFFLYHVLRWGRRPAEIFGLACIAFSGAYPDGEILKWLEVFYRRFFTQQFKRSCMPDGPKVGSVTLSPRGDWRMPSDAAFDGWLRELEGLFAEAPCHSNLTPP